MQVPILGLLVSAAIGSAWCAMSVAGETAAPEGRQETPSTNAAAKGIAEGSAAVGATVEEHWRASGQWHPAVEATTSPTSPAIDAVAPMAAKGIAEGSSAASPTTSPTSPAIDAVAPMAAKAIEVSGTVEEAAVGTPILAKEGWTAVKVGDCLASGRVIRTGLRSYVNLQFGETTTISLRSATFASIDQSYRSATAETVRMGLGYGTVRGGSLEGPIRADVVVDSPTATMAKRGTQGWQFSVEPGTGRFRISLSEYGLVEAMQKLRGDAIRSRDVLPGQYATNSNIANLWIKQEIFDRNVKFFAPEGMSQSDAEFNSNNTRGYSVVAPGGGSALAGLTGRANAASGLTGGPGRGVRPVAVLPSALGPINRPEGNFGTGGIFRKRIDHSAP